MPAPEGEFFNGLKAKYNAAVFCQDNMKIPGGVIYHSRK